MVGVRWKDNVSSEEVTKICGLKEIQRNAQRQKRL